ncbi:unnamed protein product [Cutaneotrichosporon oleaginosum]
MPLTPARRSPSRPPDAHISLAAARAAHRVRIGLITGTVLGSLAILTIAVLLVLRFRRRRRMRADLPTVVLTSPSSPHVWVVPPIPFEPDHGHLAPPKSDRRTEDESSGWEEDDDDDDDDDEEGGEDERGREMQGAEKQ